MIRLWLSLKTTSGQHQIFDADQRIKTWSDGVCFFVFLLRSQRDYSWKRKNIWTRVELVLEGLINGQSQTLIKIISDESSAPFYSKSHKHDEIRSNAQKVVAINLGNSSESRCSIVTDYLTCAFNMTLTYLTRLE